MFCEEISKKVAEVFRALQKSSVRFVASVQRDSFEPSFVSLWRPRLRRIQSSFAGSLLVAAQVHSGVLNAHSCG